jgi:hypothetical protein
MNCAIPHNPGTTQLRRLAMDNMSEPNRRTVLTAAAAAGAFGLAASAVPGPAAPAPGAEGENAIRPCHEPAKDRDFVFTRYAP